MKFDIQTLAFIQSLLFIAQLVVLFVQYRVNKSYRGIGWWVVGSFFMALSFIFMPMVSVKSLMLLAKIANPLLVLGQILLYVGITQYFETKANRRLVISIFVGFIGFYYYYMYFNNDISARTVVLNTTLVMISGMTALEILTKKNKRMSTSANFTACVFLSYSCFSFLRTIYTLWLPPMKEYRDQEEMLILAFIVPIIISNLWTCGFIIMHNQRLNIENIMEKEKMQQIFNTIPDAAWIMRLGDGVFIDVNARFLEMTGYAYDEVIGKGTLNIKLWKNWDEQKLFIAKLGEEEICENQEFVFERKGGGQFVGLISARIISIYNVPNIISVIYDISERKQAEEALLESEEQYRSILNASPDDITITDLEGRILMVSPASKKMFGYEADYEEFIGMCLVDFLVPEEVERAKSNILLMQKVGYSEETQYHAVRKDQSIFDIEVNSGFIRNLYGEPIKIVFIIRDITERKRAEQKIQALIQQLELEKNTAQLNAITDALTGIANRRYFDETLKTEFYRLKRVGDILSLLMIDVDYFKKFNDTYGHLAGDDCLRQLGSLFGRLICRAPDMVARYGGEEFMVILPKTDENGAKIIAERIRKAVEDLAILHAASDTGKYVTISIGVVTVSTKGLELPEQVVTLVDEALYRAKKNGRNRIEFKMDK